MSEVHLHILFELTVCAEQTLKLGHHSHCVQLSDEALILYARVQPHEKTTSKSSQLWTHTHTHIITKQYEALCDNVTVS